MTLHLRPSFSDGKAQSSSEHFSRTLAVQKNRDLSLWYYVSGMRTGTVLISLGTALVMFAATLLGFSYTVGEKHAIVFWVLAGVFFLIGIGLFIRAYVLAKEQEQEDRFEKERVALIGLKKAEEDELRKAREEEQRRRESARRLAPRLKWDPDSCRSKKTKE